MDCIFLIKFTGVNLNENRRQLVDAETSIQAGIIENQHLVQIRLSWTNPTTQEQEISPLIMQKLDRPLCTVFYQHPKVLYTSSHLDTIYTSSHPTHST